MRSLFTKPNPFCITNHIRRKIESFCMLIHASSYFNHQYLKCLCFCPHSLEQLAYIARFLLTVL